jgi:hypothetical protein
MVGGEIIYVKKSKLASGLTTKIIHGSKVAKAITALRFAFSATSRGFCGE